MRTRMFKMESFPAFTIKSKKMRQRLSPDEFSYCKRYVDLVFGHFMQSFLSFLPERYQDIALSNDDIEMVPKPSLDRHVFVSFRERLEDLQISTDEYISVDAGDTYLLQYGLVKDVLLNGQLNLV
ncbi:DNA replication complex GINS protein SLD5-like isoform X2 [Zophobas morio]